MRTSSIFQPDEVAARAMFDEHPLAQIFSWHGGDAAATPLPLLVNWSKDGAPRVTSVVGHFGRTNPQLDIIARNPQALITFMGHHSYVSPSWLDDRTQAPTWNYATAHLVVDIALMDTPAAARAAVDRLTAHMEAGRLQAWHRDEMGARYEQLVRGVIAFEGRVVDARYKFKLGQNERPDVLRDILDGLASEGRHDLRKWMIAQNSGRLESV
ncbi:FMN-binding negative transcriptional regulator [Qipengyuania qiaonensis]|uniref:FMN-binding negative transcriptional regulator n=1 Tax=Qipengyuania qiaonensis TaxID=2867240 RepID=A0ABS7JDJ4_9SPHN|nr:FMN-binding negative transcriptional regulator [Qipengyuania qiaonensis]MBX7484020.1 FMN-binding negative transcriptional regulator [Qipengyuania qiaonensis]